MPELQKIIDELAKTIAENINSVEKELMGKIKHLQQENAQIKQELAALELKQGEQGEKGEKGERGAGVVDALIDRAGVLVLTFEDGRTKELGQVVGKDGKDGLDGAKGADGKDGVNGLDGKDGLDGAKGADGKDGLDGKDGVSFESFALNYLEEQQKLEIIARANGEQKSVSFDIPLMRNKGYWRDGMKAQPLETYSVDGCLYIAQKHTQERPSPNSKDWILAARKGRDGLNASDNSKTVKVSK